MLFRSSNNSDNKTWGDDLSLFGTRERIATFIPSTGNIPLLLKFLPMPAEGIYSYLTNDYVFLGMLCRRGLACHYLPLYEARWRPLYEYPPQENIVFPQTEQYAFLQPIFLLLEVGRGRPIASSGVRKRVSTGGVAVDL